jgi:hypothetical protein
MDIFIYQIHALTCGNIEIVEKLLDSKRNPKYWVLYMNTSTLCYSEWAFGFRKFIIKFTRNDQYK